MSPSLVLIIAGALLVGGIVCLRPRRGPSLPPGPPAHPLTGHFLLMPTRSVATTFHEWSKAYGDVMYLQVLGRRMVILDSHAAAVELLDKRGAVYSDRPKCTLYELLGWNPSLTFLPYSQFGKQRQMHQSYLGRQRVEEIKTVQTQEARILLRNLFDCKPDQYENYISRLATGIITHLVAGHRITADDDVYLRLSHELAQATAKAGQPGNSPVDFLPWLQYFPAWFPGAGLMGVVREYTEIFQELYEYPLRAVREQQERGDAMPSFLLDQMEHTQEGEDELQLKGAAATMFGAGESTTWTVISTFILAMVLHPECQARAQEEIDSVLGKDLSRLPDFEDRQNLPFVECILQETLRWNPPLPMGVPHRVIKDDIYRGMFIPQGSLVFSNIRGIGIDENVYSNPSTAFCPFLGSFAFFRLGLARGII
ncbi:cytochrome P450 [Roridomyces roridus]|uniref:Cytochrome P450 n=1 Tax=Roridomyces roridus TaxID=1738132 RepID=A0AAD7FCV0_9AGAR|nr:cytochrome P450 [Roridomyces roridus]